MTRAPSVEWDAGDDQGDSSCDETPLTSKQYTFGNLASNTRADREARMGCGRCQGLMAGERLMDLRSDSGRFVCAAWRCVVCGDVVDPVILNNRRRVAFRRYAAAIGA
ncbi:MAG: hypothetical protein ACOYXU_06555 [Nitrospirota bacterium]